MIVRCGLDKFRVRASLAGEADILIYLSDKSCRLK